MKLWRAHEILGGVFVPLWAGFHLWEQWAAFGGRTPFVERLSRTSHGALGIGVELVLGVAPVLGWIALEVWLRRKGPEPVELRDAMAEEHELAKRLGLLTRAGSYLFFAWLVYHAAWLLAPKLSGGSEPLRTWVQLRTGLGSWLHAIPHAIGLSAIALHLWAALPRLAIALELAPTAATRRALRLSGLIMALGLVFLYVQLAGWHAAGAGTLWAL